MADTECERGLQVLRVEGSGDYRLDEEALAALLLRGDVVDCRVALVSVAGAYRGGKSFLLDFLLRYLRAEETARADGSWLGLEHEPLVGFNWRGGLDRDTTGLLLWSRPVRVTLPSGEPVAVLLMDTQGTFDDRSTMRDSSTIFAFSTLLSSVQIYNLTGNMREDDLQHLQLFTEYGRMALANDGSKPFQSLHFLIRDWSYDYEHPYGAKGGAQLLEKRLKIDAKQAAELQELRQHIRACYDSLDCFLMPHPGFAVCKPDFHGYLADISNEFKESLKELIPLILEPKNIVVKKINGQPMTGRELFYHFKEYMKIFNSDNLPLPVSILKATAEACLLSGVATARERYKRAMSRLLAVSRETLRERHASARDDAVHAFVAKKTMADEKEVDRYALQLAQEFDALLLTYELLNDAKIQKAVANAKQKYEKMVLGDCSTNHLCLHPRDLKEAHRRGLEEATCEIDINTDDDKLADSEKVALVKDLHDQFRILSVYNDSNNNKATAAALEEYCSFIESTCGSPPCVTAQELRRCHQQAYTYAHDTFKARRNRYIEYHEDSYRTLLIERIDEKHHKLIAKNEVNNKNAVQEAIHAYKEYMAPEDGDSRCLHPEDLKQSNENGQSHAFYVFAGRSTAPRRHAEDDYKDNLRLEINEIFEEIESTNTKSNISAVKESYEVYCNYAGCIFYIDLYLFLMGNSMVLRRHQLGLAAALEMFHEKRHEGPFHLRDRYRECLEKVIHARYQRDWTAFRFMIPFYPPWTKSADWWKHSLDEYLSSGR